MSDDTAEAEEPFRVGDTVRVVSGDLNALTGVVAEVRNGTVIVEYDIFGRPTPLEFGAEDLLHADG